MASKMNTKLVVILASTAIAAVGIVGAIKWYSDRTDPMRNVRMGEEAEQRGDYRAAVEAYGRAVHKNPGSDEFLAKLEGAATKVIPNTQDDAIEQFQRLRSIMRNAIRHTPTDSAKHMRLIRDTANIARLTGVPGLWEELLTVSKDMWDQVPETDPMRVEAKLYRGMATWRMSSRVVPDELIQADQDLEEYVAARPDSDLGWATLVAAQMERLERMQVDSPEATIQMQKQREKVDQTLASAVKAVPTGPETVYMVARRTLQKRFANPDQVSAEDVQRAMDNAIEFASKSQDEGLIQDLVVFLSNVRGTKNMEGAAAMLRGHLEQHPDKVDKRYNLARVLYLVQKWDESQVEVERLLAMPQLAAGYQSTIQFDLRKQAAGLAGEIAFQQFFQASLDGKPTEPLITNMEKARERLVQLEPDTNKPVVLKADAYLAYAKKEYRTGAQKFEQLLNMAGGADFDSVIFDAQCLEQTGQVGLAYQRLQAAAEAFPKNGRLLMQLARLELAMNRHETAVDTLEKVDVATLDESDKKQFAELRRQSSASSATDNPVTKLLIEATALTKAGNFEGAQAKLVEAEAQAQNKAGIWFAMSVNALQAGKREEALGYVQKALEADPANTVYKQFAATIKNEDPVDRLMEATGGTNMTEAEVAVRRTVLLGTLVQQLEATAPGSDEEAQMGGAEKVKGFLAHARKEFATQEALANTLAPDSDALHQFRFNQALMRKDWNAAQAMLVRVKELNLDGASGLVFQGRLERAMGNYGQSIRTLETAVGQVNFMAGAWRELGLSYQLVGNFGQAMNAYKQAYERNPNDLAIVKEYLALLAGQGEHEEALTILTAAQRLAPQDRSLREQALQLEYRYRSKGDVLTKRREIWRSSPEDIQNATNLAFALASTEPTRELLTDEQGRPRPMDESRWSRMTPEDRAAALKAQREAWNKESDSIVSALAGRQMDGRELMLIRSKIALLRGDDRGGEKIIQDYIASLPAESVGADLWITLGKYEQEANLQAEAEQSFKKAQEIQPKESREAQRALATLYFMSGHYAEAEPKLAEVLEKDSSSGVQHQMIECLMRQDKYEQARAQLTKLHESGQQTMVSTLLEAGIAGGLARQAQSAGKADVAQQEFAKQDGALSRAQQLDPTSPMPHLYRAQSRINEYEQSRDPAKLSDAVHSLDAAGEIRANMPEVSFARVRVFRLRGDTSAAVSELQRLVAARPEDTNARQQLINILLETNRVDSAMQVVNEAIAKYPSSTFWLEALGDIYKMRKNDQVQAAAAYQRANDIMPSATLVTKFVESLLSTPAPDYRNLKKLIEEQKEFMAGVPYLRVLYVRILMGAKQKDLAIAQLKECYKQYQQFIKEEKLLPTDIDRFGEALTSVYGLSSEEIDGFMREASGGDLSAYELRMLAVMWFAKLDAASMQKAVDLEKQALAKLPAGDTAGRMKLLLEAAVFLLQLQKYEESAKMYEEVLKMDARHPDALNNYAYVLAENLNRATEAVPYVDLALEVKPGDAEFLDTAGWVYYRAGNLDKGREYLEQSLNRRESVATAMNLAKVLMELGRFGEALDAADRAERTLNGGGTKPDSKILGDIQAMKDDIRKKQAGG